jgi:hypothetical protein
MVLKNVLRGWVEQGVVVGCDRKQEWLLKWWWSHYSAHNDYPVAFMDLGMSEKGVAWCRSKGIYVPLSFEGFEEKPIEEATKKKWEEAIGTGLWQVRSAWLKKPIAILHSPFDFSCWIDLDCEVRCNLEPLFNSILFGFDLSLVREEGDVTYNSGVIVYRRGAEILHHWAELYEKENDQFLGDQDALSRVIHLHRPSLLELNPIYNWKRGRGGDQEALILHYRGDSKLEILQKIHPELPNTCETLLLKMGAE